jgi:hypothetical protein
MKEQEKRQGILRINFKKRMHTYSFRIMSQMCKWSIDDKFPHDIWLNSIHK